MNPIAAALIAVTIGSLASSLWINRLAIFNMIKRTPPLAVKLSFVALIGALLFGWFAPLRQIISSVIGFSIGCCLALLWINRKAFFRLFKYSKEEEPDSGGITLHSGESMYITLPPDVQKQLNDLALQYGEANIKSIKGQVHENGQGDFYVDITIMVNEQEYGRLRVAWREGEECP
jgi:hypothetical protein